MKIKFKFQILNQQQKKILRLLIQRIKIKLLIDSFTKVLKNKNKIKNNFGKLKNRLNHN